jgi:hypothetical protein
MKADWHIKTGGVPNVEIMLGKFPNAAPQRFEVRALRKGCYGGLYRRNNVDPSLELISSRIQGAAPHYIGRDC